MFGGNVSVVFCVTNIPQTLAEIYFHFVRATEIYFKFEILPIKKRKNFELESYLGSLWVSISNMKWRTYREVLEVIISSSDHAVE